MATNKQTTKEIEVEKKSGLEEFIKKYGKILTTVFIAILVITAAALAVSNWYVKPLKEEAKGQTFTAEQYFRAGNYESALNGDGNALGFAEIIKEYGTKGGNAVYFYAGICELQLKNYQGALDYLKKYKGGDKILSARAQACIGDAYVGLGNIEAGLSQYEKAASMADNAYAAQYLLKAGIAAEELGQKDKAVSLYKKIEVEYPQSVEAYDIQKYIVRAQN